METTTAPKRRKMTSDEAAAYLGYTRAYLWKLNHLRKVPHHKTGRASVHYFQDELDDYLNRGRVLTDYELEAAAAELVGKMTAKSVGKRRR